MGRGRAERSTVQREQTERGPGEDLMQPIRVLAREIPGTCYFGRLSSAAGNRNALELESLKMNLILVGTRGLVYLRLGEYLH